MAIQFSSPSTSTTLDLVRLTQLGGPAAKDAEERLLAASEGLVKTAVRRIQHYGSLDEDLLQEARLALTQAMRQYDVAKGASFSTFAWRVMTNALLKARRNSELPAQSLDDPALGASSLPDQLPLFADDFELRSALETLDNGEREVITQLYFNGDSQTAVAKRLSVSHTAIQKRQQRALRKLRYALSA